MIAERVSRIQHVKSDLSEIATLDYEYDRVGNPTKIAREDGSATYYDYDDIYQLTGELQVDDEEAVEYAFEYDYDGAHNRTVKVVDGVPTYYTYNAANELLTETTGGETTYYHYDGCGNTVAKQEAAGTTYYAYNTENLMTRIDFAAGGNSYYDYDADSKRVSQRTADGFRQFVYQGPDMLKLQLERDESEETVAHYTMGSGLEAMRRDSASSFYHYNHLGTALALTGGDEAVTDAYRHDAWGVLLASTGSTVNPHTYVGRERYYRMPNASMYHLGFRDYAQGVGRPHHGTANGNGASPPDPLSLETANGAVSSGRGGRRLRQRRAGSDAARLRAPAPRNGKRQRRLTPRPPLPGNRKRRGFKRERGRTAVGSLSSRSGAEGLQPLRCCPQASGARQGTAPPERRRHALLSKVPGGAVEKMPSTAIRPPRGARS